MMNPPKKPKRTVLIQHKHPFINNFEIINDDSHVEGFRVIRQPFSGYATNSHGEYTNCDILITDEAVLDPIVDYSRTYVVQLPRYDKRLQQKMLFKAAKDLYPDKWQGEQHGFVSLRTMDINDRKAISIFHKCRVVAKSPNGARSMGMIVIDFNKIGYVKAMTKLKGIIEAAHDRDEEAMLKVANHPAFEIIKGTQNHDKEYLQYIAEINMIQEVVEDVIEEYRILTNHHGEIIWAQPRERKGNGFLTASGADGSVDIIYSPGPFMENNPLIYKQLTDLIKTCRLNMNSLDLFINKDGNWGLFEFSNQWGIAGVNPEFAIDMQAKAIHGYLIDAGYLYKS